MGRTLDRLKAERKLGAWIDLRTGGIAEISGNNLTTSIQGVAKWVRKNDMYALQCIAGGLKIDSAASLEAENFTDIIFGLFVRNSTTSRCVSQRDASSTRYEWYQLAGGFSVFSSVTRNATYAFSPPNSPTMLAAQVNAGAAAKLFANGQYQANFASTFAVNATSAPVYIGSFYNNVNCLNNNGFISMYVRVNGAISDKEISEIYSEYMAEGGISQLSGTVPPTTYKPLPAPTDFLFVDGTMTPNGKLADLSGNGVNLPLGSGSIRQRTSTYDRAVRMSDLTHYAIANYTGLSNKTKFVVEGVMSYLGTTGTYQTLFAVYAAPTTRVDISSKSGDVTGLTCSIANGAASSFTTSASIIPANQPFHFKLIYDGTKSTNEERAKIEINGVQVPLTYTLDVPSATPNLTTTSLFLGKFTASSYHTNIVLSWLAFGTEDVRTRVNEFLKLPLYKDELEGAPITTAVVPVNGRVPYTEYRNLGIGDWYVVDYQGKRMLTNSSTASVSRPSKQTSGTWVIELIKTDTGAAPMFVIFNDKLNQTIVSSGGNGYYFGSTTSETVTLRRIVAGATTSLWTSANALSLNVAYKFAIMRPSRLSLTWNIYVKGGEYPLWTLLGTVDEGSAASLHAASSMGFYFANTGGNYTRILGTHLGMLSIDDLNSMYP
jgi:hypothetical protein